MCVPRDRHTLKNPVFAHDMSCKMKNNSTVNDELILQTINERSHSFSDYYAIVKPQDCHNL